MSQLSYWKLDYDRKLLYLRSVFDEAKSAHPTYQKLYVLLSGKRKIQESYLDQLYEQVDHVIENLTSETALAKMGELAQKIARIRALEAKDHEQELKEIAQMEKDILKINDDRPSGFGV